MASPSRSSLSRCPSRSTIRPFLSRTISTSSSILDPDRTLGRILSAGERRLQPALDRAADCLGYGPSAVVRRLLTLLQKAHIQEREHFEYAASIAADNLVPVTGAEGDLDPVLQALINTVCFPCPACHHPLSQTLSVVGPDCRALLSRLLGYARLVASVSSDVARAERTVSSQSSHPELSIRTLTLKFVTVLVIADEAFRDYIIQINAIQLVEECRMLALLNRRGGDDVVSSFCLQMLREPYGILFFVEPHCLNVIRFRPDQPDFSVKQDHCVAYIKTATSGPGLRTIVENTL